MTKRTLWFIVFGVCMGLAGCIPGVQKPFIPPENKGSRLSEQFFEKARTLEAQTDFIEARKNYDFSLTAVPRNTAAERGMARMNQQLKILADQYYQKSRLLDKKGKYHDARTYLLMCLRHWPDHMDARKAILAHQNQPRPNHLRHTLKKGETFSAILEFYYGSTEPSPAVEQINKVRDPARLKAGTRLTIPELSDYPFIRKKAKGSIGPMAEDTDPQTKKSDPILMYKNLAKDFFDNQEFENSVVEFQKVLGTDPSDIESRTYLSKAYYEMGLMAQARKKTLEAMDYYQTALSYDHRCELCQNRIAQIRKIDAGIHYKAGMKYFDAQDLARAIHEWTVVQKIDPAYKQVTELLQRAKTIQKNIEAIRKSE